ncbi:PREDICTED: uncharacterized protein LOC108558027, partial [Nicrophorus vespilloides]|uniref:Uncharacterized protein LOC108558027 n=1 Tax=Nicrophorus vespilloides TaxID=110193 RepID=A0ABM1M6V3_NICVS
MRRVQRMDGISCGAEGKHARISRRRIFVDPLALPSFLSRCTVRRPRALGQVPARYAIFIWSPFLGDIACSRPWLTVFSLSWHFRAEEETDGGRFHGLPTTGPSIQPSYRRYFISIDYAQDVRSKKKDSQFHLTTFYIYIDTHSSNPNFQLT